jgi:hypothetical protein
MTETLSLSCSRDPVKRRLGIEPEPWVWISFLRCADGRRGPAPVNVSRAELRVRKSSGAIVGGDHASKSAKRGATSAEVA